MQTYINIQTYKTLNHNKTNKQAKIQTHKHTKTQIKNVQTFKQTNTKTYKHTIMQTQNTKIYKHINI